jgi:hypothetical protein
MLKYIRTDHISCTSVSTMFNVQNYVIKEAKHVAAMANIHTLEQISQ